MKVAIIEPVGGHSGMDYYDFGLLDGLVTNQVDCTLYTCDLTQVPAVYNGHVVRCFKKIYGTQPVTLRGISYLLGLMYAVVHSVLRGARIHHYHFFHCTTVEVISIFLSKLFCRKVVITLHDLSSLSGSDNPGFKRWIYSTADHLIVQSASCMCELLATHPELEQKTSIIHPGNYCHSIKKIDGNDCKLKLGLPRNKKIILFFGQIKKVKGLDVLIKAIAELSCKRDDIVFVIAGRTWKDDTNTYLSLIREHKIEDITVFHNRFINNNEVDFYYNSADLICVPYRKSYYSAVLLMGMSYGKAVIASNLPIFKEIITDGLDGIVFKDGDSHDLATRINITLCTETLTEIGNAAHLRMISEFSWTLVGKKLTSVYNNLLKG